MRSEENEGKLGEMEVAASIKSSRSRISISAGGGVVSMLLWLLWSSSSLESMAYVDGGGELGKAGKAVLACLHKRTHSPECARILSNLFSTGNKE